MVKRFCLPKKLQTQGFKILADFLAVSGHNIEVEEIGYKFKNRVLGESKMSLLTALELISLVCLKFLEEKFQ